MGSSGSKIVKKIFGPSNNKENRRRPSFTSPLNEEDFSGLETVVARIPPSLGPSLVMYRQGSMFFDEDGDLAHEFYVEVKEGRKSKMKRVYENLKPQGKVRLPFPRLSNDCPVILYRCRWAFVGNAALPHVVRIASLMNNKFGESPICTDKLLPSVREIRTLQNLQPFFTALSRGEVGH